MGVPRLPKKLPSFNPSLKETAENNASVTMNQGKPSEKIIKSGTPLDHIKKHTPYEGCIVGESLGATINMGDYQSLRIDTWITDTVREGETPEKAYLRLYDILDETITRLSSNYKPEE